LGNDSKIVINLLLDGCLDGEMHLKVGSRSKPSRGGHGLGYVVDVGAQPRMAMKVDCILVYKWIALPLGHRSMHKASCAYL
jgi:hypothetical protein